MMIVEDGEDAQAREDELERESDKEQERQYFLKHG